MTKKKTQPEQEAPPDVEAQQIADLLPVLVPFITRAMSVKDYLRSHDRQMRERQIVALERIADTLDNVFVMLVKKADAPSPARARKARRR